MARVSKALSVFEKVFGRSDAVIIGAVHLGALPGTPRSSKSLEEIIDTACSDAAIYIKHGVDALIIENTHDVPYMKTGAIGPEIVTSMTRVCGEIRRKFPKAPIGVQVLAGGNFEAIAVAHATNLNFIRAESYVYSSVADEGWMDACAGPLMRYRKNIGAENVLVLADIKKKHGSHSITADLTPQDMALAAEYFMVDGVIITGKMTGSAADPQESSVTQKAVQLPVLIGSGVTSANLHAFAGKCDGIIVGSDFKVDGKWYNPVEEKRVEKFMSDMQKLRKTILKEQEESSKPAATSDFIG